MTYFDDSDTSPLTAFFFDPQMVPGPSTTCDAYLQAAAKPWPLGTSLAIGYGRSSQSIYGRDFVEFSSLQFLALHSGSPSLPGGEGLGFGTGRGCATGLGAGIGIGGGGVCVGCGAVPGVGSVYPPPGPSEKSPS